MEPQIRYVRSADGTRIAVHTMGQGRPLVILPAVWIVSMEASWKVPAQREGLERLAENRMVVRFDNRGQGLSERDVTDFSLEARVADVTAVVDSLDAEHVDLYALSNAAPAAISFAANNDRIHRMILSSASARGRAFRVSEQRRAIAQLIEVDWPLYVKTVVLQGFGWTETGRQVAESAIDSISPQTFAAAMQAVASYDASSLAPRVRCPTLVMHRKQQQETLALEAAQTLAATIPGARLVILESETPLVLVGEANAAIIEEFLDEESGREPRTALPSGTVIILFADIADSTGLTERIGDSAFRAKARDLDSVMRSAITECGGATIEGKLLGDGVLAVFTSAQQAIQAAQRCGEAGDGCGLPLHLGVHAGDVIREDDNVYGGAVNIAARIAAASAPGEILVSETVRSLAKTSSDVSFVDRGQPELKGISEALRVYAVHA
jgi:class 3 adenylate cyclase